jgi:hypothetical protein
MLYFITAKGQNIITADGEFIDTTRIGNPKCGTKYVISYDHGKYPESPAMLLKKVQDFRKRQNSVYSGSGYITFQFGIDCEGKMLKRVKVLQTDEHYKKFHFDRSFVNELYDFSKSLDKWTPATFRNGSTDSIYLFTYNTYLTFKIQDGKVINVAP